METDHVKENIDIQYKKLQRQFRKIGRKGNADAIHLFRLEYKKIRTVLHILSFGKSKAASIKISKKLKKIYAIAGNIRELQLQQKMALRNKCPVGYLADIKTSVAKQKEKLSRHNPSKIISASRKKVVDLIPRNVLPESVNNYFIKRQAMTGNIISSKKISDADLHTIRKNLKELLYILQSDMLPRKSKSSADAVLETTQLLIGKIIDELGQYNDRCVSINLLQHYVSKNQGFAAHNKIKKMMGKLVKEKRAMRVVLVKKLKSGTIQRNSFDINP